MQKIILASASPRRIEIMKKHGFKPEIVPAHIDEVLPFSMSSEASVMYLALKKALNVSLRVSYSNSILIAADTVVIFENKIIGKPKTQEEAFTILKDMRGKRHHVITGVCILETYNNLFISKTCLYEKTAVYFKQYSDAELISYTKTPEPYDKAGGYAIQGTFGKYVDHIEGDYNNVVGLPWHSIKPCLT